MDSKKQEAGEAETSAAINIQITLKTSNQPMFKHHATHTHTHSQAPLHVLNYAQICNKFVASCAALGWLISALSYLSRVLHHPEKKKEKERKQCKHETKIMLKKKLFCVSGKSFLTSHQASVSGFAPVNWPINFLKELKMAGERCLRLKSEERKRNEKQMAEDWHPTSAVRCGRGLFAQPGAAGSVRQEHWRIYCRNTVKPPDEWKRRWGSKARHFCLFRVKDSVAQGCGWGCRAQSTTDLKSNFNLGNLELSHMDDRKMRNQMWNIQRVNM